MNRNSLNRSNPNGALYYSQRSVPPMEDEDSLTQFLKEQNKQGFATSSYWGNNGGEVPPREADDVVGNHGYRFQDEINRKLVPFPKETTSMPINRDYTLTGFHKFKEGAGEALNAGSPMNANQLAQLNNARGLSGGLDPASTKPRFLTTETSTQRMPARFDDDVMRTLAEGQQLEDELRRKLEELKKDPYGTGEPDAYRLTSDDYIDMTGIDPSSWRVREEDPNNPGSTLDVYRSRYNNVEKEGPKRRDRTARSIQRQLEVDPRALRSTLMASTKSQMPRGYEPWSAQDWKSTTHTEHADYNKEEATLMNTRDATVPLRNRNYALNPDQELAVSARDYRQQTRNQGEWNTEYTENYEDRHDQAELDKSHAVKGVWDIKNGVYTINPHFHHPRDDTDTGEIYTASQIVPGQYTTMSKQPLHAKNLLESTRK